MLRSARRIVVKVGSSLVTNEGRGLDEKAIGEWCRQLAALAQDGREVIMVSSGAIAEGMKRLGWSARPDDVHKLQAAAAVGQMGLAQMYESKLREHGMGAAQVLLTHADLADRERLPQCTLEAARRRWLQHRPGRHDHQSAGGQARRRFRRIHHDRLGPRAGLPDAAGSRRDHRHAARSADAEEPGSQALDG
jgi:hypothetical protein